MTTKQKNKATLFLLDDMYRILAGDRYRLPMVFMVGDEVCLTFYSALRYQQQRYVFNDEQLPISIFTIQQAYKLKYGKNMNKTIENTVYFDYDTKGEHSKEDKFYEWQFRLLSADEELSSYFKNHRFTNKRNLFTL